MDFTLTSYADLITSLMGSGYQISGYAESTVATRHLVLRHDVDFDLEAALQMADVEAQNGWRGHYFVLLRSEFYNPLSKPSRAALNRLLQLGHEVGLHFDAALYEGDEKTLIDAAQQECGMLEDLTGRRVEVYSLHRPATFLLDRELIVPDRINAYGARHFRDIGYCSDSRGAWYHGHPLEHEAVAQGRALQLLTHPIWWVRDDLVGAQAKLEGFLARHQDIVDRSLAANCTVYLRQRLDPPNQAESRKPME
jgi:hypothetical protein